MSELSDTSADKLQAVLNQSSAGPNDDLRTEYRHAVAMWYAHLTEGQRWRFAMVLAASERGAEGDAEQLAAALPPAPRFSLS